MNREDFKAKVSMALGSMERETWEDFLEAVWQLHLEASNHWIPVEERLPPFDCIEDGSCRCSQPVLIYDPIRAWIYVGRYESDDLYGNTYWVYGNGKRPTREVCGGYEIDNVTHWMPLPQAPRNEDKK